MVAGRTGFTPVQVKGLRTMLFSCFLEISLTPIPIVRVRVRVFSPTGNL